MVDALTEKVVVSAEKDCQLKIKHLKLDLISFKAVKLLRNCYNTHYVLVHFALMLLVM